MCQESITRSSDRIESEWIDITSDITILPRVLQGASVRCALERFLFCCDTKLHIACPDNTRLKITKIKDEVLT